MPNFVKIPRQLKEFSILALDSDCSVCMVAIRNRGPISVQFRQMRSFLVRKAQAQNFRSIYISTSISVVDFLRGVFAFAIVSLCSVIDPTFENSVWI